MSCRFIHDIRMPVNSYLLPLVALTKMRLKRVSLNVKKIQTVFGMCRTLPLTLKTLVQPMKQSYGSIANRVKAVQHGCLKPIMASNYPVRFSWTLANGLKTLPTNMKKKRAWLRFGSCLKSVMA